MPILPSQRHLFDIPEDIAYFNCAYNSPQLHESRRRLHAGVDAKCHPWERTVASFFDDAETIRRLSSQICGGDAGDYSINPAASYGLSSAARAIEPLLRPGDEILVLAEEFPSIVLPMRSTAKASGASIVTVPTPQHGGWTQPVLDHIHSKVKVVALSNCHWTDGAYLDLSAIGDACRRVGASLIVDATQSLGAMPFSIEQVQPDFLVAAGYKWLLCPYGVGIMYVSERWQGGRPLEESWLSRDNAQDFAGLVKYSDGYMPGARRYDVGEKCTSTDLPGAIAALEQIAAWGVENIAGTLAQINARIAATLQALGCSLPVPAERCPHMFGARLPEGYSGNLVAALKARDIFISQRGNALRFAPHLHVSELDIERLLAALAELI